MRRQFVVLCIIVSGICAAVVSFAQSKPQPRFEVASVRAYTLDSGFRNLHRTTDARVDRIRFMGMLLMEAFRQPSFYRISAPDWVNEVMVEIQATMPAGTTIHQVPEMLHTLLEERFGLVTHREARPIDAYELVVAPDGVKMKEVEPVNELGKELHLDPSSGLPQREVYARETPNGPVRVFQVPGGGSTSMTSRTLYERRTIPNEGSMITATRMSMSELVSELEPNVDKPVVDKTGLTGVYQFTLQLPRDALVTRLLGVVTGTLGASTSARVEPAGGVSVFKELERLGLKLEKRRIPVEVIVVDTISRTPTAN